MHLEDPSASPPAASTSDSLRPFLWPVAAFAALYSLILIAGLGLFPFIGPDEPRYAQVAREMFASGDYVSPRLCGLLWFEKPALFYWAAAASYHLFGANEFGARLPCALAALVTCAFIAYALRRVRLGGAGVIAGVILATSLIWVGFAHAATTDMMLAATTAIALLSFFLATTLPAIDSNSNSNRARLGFLLLGAAFTGLAMIAKGLIGVLLVVIILVAHRVLARRSMFRHWSEAALAVGVFVLVASTWYVPVTLRNGSVFIDEFFVNHHFKRYLTNKYQHPQPAYFYIGILLGGALPWSFFVLPAIARLKYLRPREGARDSLLALCWAWMLLTVGFFSFSTSKLPGYILPAFPALAIILAVEAERVWSGERGQLLRVASVLNAVTLMLISVGALGYLRKKELVLPPFEAALCWLPMALGVLALGATLSRKPRLAVAAPALAMLGVAAVGTLLLTKIGDSLGARQYSVAVANALRPGESILFYKRKKQYSHVFYSNGRVAFYKDGRPIQGMSTGDQVGIESAQELQTALSSKPSFVLVTAREQEAELIGDARFEVREVARQDDLVALRVSLVQGGAARG